MVKARAGWMGMGRGAGSTALGLFQILPVFLCIFPSGKEQPLYFADFFLVFLAALGSPPPFPCPWASFPLPLLAAVCHMFKISSFGARTPSSPLPEQSRWVFFLYLIFFVSPLLIPQGRRWWKSKRPRQPGGVPDSAALPCRPLPGCSEKQGGHCWGDPHMNTPI